MVNSYSNTPEQITQLIKKGHSFSLLENIQSVLSDKKTTKEVQLVYQLLKCKALTKLSHHNEALNLLEEIKKELFEIGNEIQQIDYYICQAENLEGLGRVKEGLELLDKAEEIDLNSSTLDSETLLRIKIDLLFERTRILTIKRRYFEFYLPNNFNELIDAFDECINLSNEGKYNYGLAISLEYKGWFLYHEGKVEEALEYYEKANEIYKRDENKIGIGSILVRKGMIYALSGKFNSAIDLLEEASEIGIEFKIKRLIGFVHFVLNLAYIQKGEMKLAQKHGKIASDTYREIGDTTITAIALSNYAKTIFSNELDDEKRMSLIYEALSYAKEAESTRTIHAIQTAISGEYIHKGELNKALEFIEDLRKYFSEIKDYEGLAIAQAQKGFINLKKGDLDKALKNYSDSVRYHKIRGHISIRRASFVSLGDILRMKGNYEKALYNFYEAKKISEELKNRLSLASDYWNLIRCYVEIDEIEKANTFLRALKEINQELDYKNLEILTKLSTAYVFKRSKDEKERMIAKESLEFIINQQGISYQLFESAILNLCDLLLIELKISEEKELIEQLKFHVERLQEVGFRELTYPLLVQTYWLQSQISLLELDAEKAQEYYIKAQSIAEEKDLEFMARQISAEHDFLIGQLDLWKKFTAKLPSIVEILELTRIEDMLNQMLKKGVVRPSEIIQEFEDPALIFILSESGEILFTEKIAETIGDELIARVLPEIRTRIEEESGFEIVKRGKLYDYSYIIKLADSLFFCYFFVGKSYQAIKRLEEFSSVLIETSAIWNQLLTSSKSDLTLNFEERKSITSFIDKIFLAR